MSQYEKDREGQRERERQRGERQRRVREREREGKEGRKLRGGGEGGDQNKVFVSCCVGGQILREYTIHVATKKLTRRNSILHYKDLSMHGILFIINNNFSKFYGNKL